MMELKDYKAAVDKLVILDAKKSTLRDEIIFFSVFFVGIVFGLARIEFEFWGALANAIFGAACFHCALNAFKIRKVIVSEIKKLEAALLEVE